MQFTGFVWSLGLPSLTIGWPRGGEKTPLAGSAATPL
jgi:hypothetical protein